MALETRGLAKSRDKSKTYLHHHKQSIGHQIWKDDELLWEALTSSVTWSFNNVVLRSHVINQIFYISTWTRPMVMTHCWGIPPIMLQNSLNRFVTWGHAKNWIYYNSICSRPMVIKLGKVVTSNERLQRLNSHDLTLFIRLMTTKLGSVLRRLRTQTRCPRILVLVLFTENTLVYIYISISIYLYLYIYIYIYIYLYIYIERER